MEKRKKTPKTCDPITLVSVVARRAVKVRERPFLVSCNRTHNAVSQSTTAEASTK
jgi:hypothetical protein